jgi:nitrous oxidase accessory protein NosD
MSFKPHPPAALALLLTGAAIGVSAFMGSQALAAPLACGDTITADTKLDSDLVDCPNNGIVIGANNVTLDLNGHTVDGDGEFVDHCSRNELCDVGVASERHNGLTIKGGRVKQFGIGVGVFDAQHADLRQLTVSKNIDLGIVLAEAERSEVRTSSVTANGLHTDEAGLGVFFSHHVKIRRNSISRNGDIGLIMFEADNIRIKKNTVADHPEAGMLLAGDNNKVASNRVVRNSEGIGFAGNDNAITRNQVLESGLFGINRDGGDRNLIAHNKVRGAGRQGILVGVYGSHGRDNAVIANRVRDVGRDGVRVGKKVTDTVLRRNRVRDADDDGIDVRRASATLTRNRASHNHDLGITAADGVSDGGGNRASGNGDSRQCLNVRCHR